MQSVLYSQHNEAKLHIPNDIGKYERDLVSFLSYILRSRNNETVTLYTLLRGVSNKDRSL